MAGRGGIDLEEGLKAEPLELMAMLRTPMVLFNHGSAFDKLMPDMPEQGQMPMHQWMPVQLVPLQIVWVVTVVPVPPTWSRTYGGTICAITDDQTSVGARMCDYNVVSFWSSRIPAATSIGSHFAGYLWREGRQCDQFSPKT